MEQTLAQWLDEATHDPRADAELKGAPVPSHIQIIHHPEVGWAATIQYADGTGRTGDGTAVV
jgi:hypothetical protein